MFKLAADKGDPDGEYALGMAYRFGRGVSRDLVMGFRYLLRAASKGLAEAQFSTGLCYSHGEGVKRDLGEAAKWYKKAARQGDADAKHNLKLLKSASRVTASAPNGLKVRWAHSRAGSIPAARNRLRALLRML